MSDVVHAEAPEVKTNELWPALDEALGASIGAGRKIVRLIRQASSYRSSFALEELQVGLDDDTSLRVMFKNLSRSALLREAQAAKPEFLHDPRREIETYRQILDAAQLGTAVFYGAVSDAGRHWLFIEKVAGVELYQVGERRIWHEAAAWLARLHARFFQKADIFTQCVPLLRHDAAFCRGWMQRARDILRDAELPIHDRDTFKRLADDYEPVIAGLQALPMTLMHGDFFASNVLVQETGAGVRVCPVDWEMAAIGPALMDLAALCAGKWTDAERREIALAYCNAWPAEQAPWPTTAAFLRQLDLCRLQLAVQCLGWAPNWSPPPAQTHDWLRDLVSLARRREQEPCGDLSHWKRDA